MARKFLATLTLPVLAQDPTDGTMGSMYWNTTSNQLMMHNGSGWVTANSSQYNLEDHIHTYDGPIHTIFGASQTATTIYDGGGV